MRASIVAWSTFSGVLLGVFADVLLAGIWAIATTVVPTLNGRAVQGWVRPASIAVLVAIPLALGVLGYLEGQLKA